MNDVIGSIEGTATFEWVEVSTDESNQTVRVHGYYDGDTTVYECDIDQVTIGGMKIRQMFDSFQLEPTEDNDWIWVEATEDELHIIEEKPDNDNN